MSYYRNASDRALSVTVTSSEAALVPPNCFVKVDPRVERRYSTKKLVSLGLLVRCGRPGGSDVCIQVDDQPSSQVANITPSKFAESLIEFSGTTNKS